MAVSRKSRRRAGFRKGNRKGNKLATVATVKRLMIKDKEIKYVAGTSTFTNCDWLGLNQQLNIIGQGTDEGQRIGDQIKHHAVDVRYTVAVGTAQFARFRVIMYWYRQESGVSPTAADILFNTGTNLAVVSPYNWRNQGRFTILYDKILTVTGSNTANTPIAGSGNSVGGMPVFNGRIFRRLKGKVGQYTGPLNADDMSKGYLGLIFISDNAAGVATAVKPLFGYTYLVRYTDS